MPSLALEIPILALLGAAAVTFAATINSTLQLAVAPEMRGRVMALYSVVFLGSTPIGGPLTGWLSQAYDPRVALLLAGIAGLSAAWAAHVSLRPACEPTRTGAAEPAAEPDCAMEPAEGLAGHSPLLSGEPLRRRLSLAGVAGRLQVRRRRFLRRLLFEFDPGVELLHHRQRQALPGP